MDELKRGFWGYKKDSVCRYIVWLEEEASKRIAEKDARMDELETGAQRQIDALERAHEEQTAEQEAVIAALREENRALREDQELVSATMLEAQRYAGQLKADSSRQAQQAQEELSGAIQRKRRELDGYMEQIRQLRATIRDLLEGFDGRAEEAERALEHLQAQAPGADLDGKAPDVKLLFGGAPAAGAETAAPDRGKGETWNKLSFI